MTNTLLMGVVGSRAYGLDTPASDTDYLGIHALDTHRLFTIASQPPETISQRDENDRVSHEVHKACKLMFSCNPTLLETLWLDDYTTMTPLGEELRGIRKDFLSRRRIADAYIGFADQQFKRLEHRGRFQGSLDTRREKHARHLLRMTEQGTYLLRTGEMKLKVDDPRWIRDTAKEIAESGDSGVALAREFLDSAKDEVDEIISPIPLGPRYDRVEAFIQRVRRHFWKDPS